MTKGIGNALLGGFDAGCELLVGRKGGSDEMHRTDGRETWCSPLERAARRVGRNKGSMAKCGGLETDEGLKWTRLDVAASPWRSLPAMQVNSMHSFHTTPF